MLEDAIMSSRETITNGISSVHTRESFHGGTIAIPTILRRARRVRESSAKADMSQFMSPSQSAFGQISLT